MLELRNISAGYGATEVLHGLSLTAEEGKITTLIGGNGAGKSTLLNAVAGVWPVDGGSIVIDGNDITGLPDYKRAPFIGRVFQDPMMGTAPDMQLEENLALAYRRGKKLGLRWHINREERDMYRERLRELNLGLEDRLTTKVGLLSGGQRQALALLLSTLTPVDLLILDEHTAALDPKSSENVMELTEKFVREKQLTAIMVTHNLRYAVAYGDRLVMMHQGQVVKDAAGADKEACKVDDLLKIFNEISIECGN